MNRTSRLTSALGLAAAGACLLALLAATPSKGSDAEQTFTLPGTQPSDGSGDPAFPAFEDDGGAPGTFDTPTSCRACHGNYRQFGEPVYEPYDSWGGSLMANSARDPLFWATLDVVNKDDREVLGGKGIGAFCLKCHVPRGHYAGRTDCDTPWGERYDGSCLEGPPTARDNDFEGISCHYCHRQYDASMPPEGDFADPNAPYTDNAGVYLSKARNVMRGPYPDAQPPGHGFANSEFHESSAYCGQCHNVTHPVVNRVDPDTGEDLGYKIPVDRTYDEWTQSVFADPARAEYATCQACHMPVPDTDGDGRPNPAVACTTPPGLRGFGTELDGPVRSHFFRGGSTFMLQVLKGEYGRALRREQLFDATIEQSLALLQNETVSVFLEATGAVEAGGEIAATVRVENLAGHKFPAGFAEGRRAFVNVRGGEDRDGDGMLDDDEVSFESGRYDGATGKLETDPQIRIYEALYGIYDFNGDGECDVVNESSGKKMFHFALNDCIAKDNRIPPKGFTPSDETAPVRASYPENPTLPGTLVNWDVIDYVIPVPDDAYRPFLVDAKVYYQSSSSDFIEFLRDQNTNTCDPFDEGCDPTVEDPRPNRGEKMYELWERYGRSEPVEVGGAAATTDVSGTFPVPGEAGPLVALRWNADLQAVEYTFDAACEGPNNALYWGDLIDVGSYAYSDARCSIGEGGQTLAFQPGAGSVFFLVAAQNGQVEGSYGTASDGAERPEDLTLCSWPQDLNSACP